MVAWNGRPVSSPTSSARTTRRPFVGRIAAAAAGSLAARRACRAGAPTTVSSASSRARPAHEDGVSVAAGDVVEHGDGGALVPGHRRLLRHVEDVEQVVWHAAPLG